MHGGLTDKPSADLNSLLFIADLNTKAVETVKPPTFFYQKKLKFMDHLLCELSADTLLLIGGSSPPLGHGGRIFMYSTKKNDIDKCDLGQHCLVDAKLHLRYKINCL